MSLSEPKQLGFALAALLAGDRDLTAVRGAIADADATSIANLLGARAGSRDTWVAGLLAALRPALTALPPGLPPRIAGLLATRLSRPVGRAVRADAPPLRPDFSASSALTPRLLRIARALQGGGPAC